MTKNRMVASRTQAVLRASASAARGGLPGVVDGPQERARTCVQSQLSAFLVPWSCPGRGRYTV